MSWKSKILVMEIPGIDDFLAIGLALDIFSWSTCEIESQNETTESHSLLADCLTFTMSHGIFFIEKQIFPVLSLTVDM